MSIPLQVRRARIKAAYQDLMSQLQNYKNWRASIQAAPGIIRELEVDLKKEGWNPTIHDIDSTTKEIEIDLTQAHEGIKSLKE